MSLLTQLFAFIITLLLLISIHEAGHFLVARLLKISVLRYAIGFGKPIFKRKGKKGTEYIIGIIPLGGYVKLLDEREVSVPEEEKRFAFNRQPLWARTLVVLAGPMMNFIFAILGFWLMLAIGVQVYKPIIGSVESRSIAEEAGIKPGDEVVQINRTPVNSAQKMLMIIIEHLGQKDRLLFTVRNIYSHHQHTASLNLSHWAINGLEPDLLQSLGIKLARPPFPAIIKEVDTKSPASESGLRAHDHIVSMNGHPVDWYQLVDYIRLRPDEWVTLTYLRSGQTNTTKIRVGRLFSFVSRPSGYLGIRPKPVVFPPSLLRMRQYSLIESAPLAVSETWQFIRFNYIIVKKMLWGEISLSSLGGPISIYRTADVAFSQGIAVFLGFLSMISVMLGFINLLPIPGLDGGYLFNYLLEFILRRPLSLKYEYMSMRIGLFALLLIMLIATVNDILRIALQ